MPWPESGCAISEARKRTADCDLWTRRCALISRFDQGRGDNKNKFKAEIRSIEEKIETAFLEHLKRPRLITYGVSHRTADLRLISSAYWQAPTKLDLENSSTAKGRPAGAAFF